MAALRIAMLAPLHEAVPPLQYGGTERVVSWLTEELVRRGHRVTLFASGDSRTRAELVPVTPVALRPCAAGEVIGPHLLEIGLLRDRLSAFDVVHSHVDFFALPFRRPGDPPLVTTLHGRLDLPEFFPIYTAFRSQAFVSISDAQRLPVPMLRWVATVHHGLPLADYPAGEGRGDYVLFLGRMSPEKRPHAAIDLARQAGVRLVLAAKVDPVDRAYYEDAIVPRLGGPGIEYVGETNLATTLELLRDARALLFPIDWPEPFGLVMIEAMACGTPVLTRRCGSVPEIVEHGTTGFVGDDDDALALALRRIDRIDRAACRRSVATRFTVEHMADGYEAVYRRLVREERTGRWTTSSGYTIATTSSPPPGSRTTGLES
ncbi:MAG TPA: glycosyltransferase family 4 protein [Acidimicrobiia bacterium]|nr:glycosyltransferase family 4 protein [Acidimicrobiia bacterium]